eukprot:364644-Chlamydomonas_euryale.AAC.14
MLVTEVVSSRKEGPYRAYLGCCKPRHLQMCGAGRYEGFHSKVLASQSLSQPGRLTPMAADVLRRELGERHVPCPVRMDVSTPRSPCRSDGCFNPSIPLLFRWMFSPFDPPFVQMNFLTPRFPCWPPFPCQIHRWTGAQLPVSTCMPLASASLHTIQSGPVTCQPQPERCKPGIQQTEQT